MPVQAVARWHAWKTPARLDLPHEERDPAQADPGTNRIGKIMSTGTREEAAWLMRD